MRIAVIEQGVVTSVIVAGEGWQEMLGIEGVESDTANVGDLWDGEAFTAPAPPPPTESELLAYAALKRWQVETGGIVVSGTAVRTDETSQAKIQGAVQLLAADETLTEIDWEAQPGVWVSLDTPALLAIGIAVGRHVQACFSTLRQVQTGIAAGEIITIEDIDAAGWPSNT